MSKLFGSVGVTGLPSVREGDADSACCLWFCLVMYVCPFFPLVFGMGFGFWFGRFLGVFATLVLSPNVILPNLSERIF